MRSLKHRYVIPWNRHSFELADEVFISLFHWIPRIYSRLSIIENNVTFPVYGFGT